MLNRTTTFLSIIVFTLLAIFYAYPSPKQTVIMSLSSKLSITDVSLKGEKVLIRVDFNVPYVPPPPFPLRAVLMEQPGQGAEHH